MEEIKTKAEQIVEHTEELVRNYISLTEIKLAQKTIKISSLLLISFVLIFTGLLALLFVSIGTAWWLGTLMDNVQAGYFIVAGLYMILFIIVLLLRKHTIVPFLENILIKKIYE